MIHNVDPQLNQWDVGISVKESDSNATHVHFANQGDSKAVIIEITDGEAKIPDYLLQAGKTVIAYAVLNGVTLESRAFAVRKRERPENYVYEEDQRNYIYTLITNAENATVEANQAAQNAKEAANAANNAAAETIKAKEEFIAQGNEVLETVHGAATENSPGIVCNVSGEILHLPYASNRVLQGLVIYGKTTQNGTDLVSAGESGSIGVTMEGKNLFYCNSDRANTYTGMILTCKAGDSTFVLNGTSTNEKSMQVSKGIPLKAGTYTASVNGLNVHNTTHDRMIISFTKADGTEIYVNKIQPGAPKTFTYDGDGIVSVSVVFAEGTTYNSKEISFQIEYGDTATAYEPYKPVQTLTASTPNGLRGTPVSSGGNYIDASGQQWIADYRDYGRGVDVQIVGLHEPIETPIPEAEMAAYYALHTNKPNTTVYNDAGAHMELSYVADTKMYIDNKFNELASALVNNT